LPEQKKNAGKSRAKRAVPGESNREKFIRLADFRTNNVLNQIRILGGLANARYYDYNNEDVDIIFDTLQNALEETRAKFLSSAKEEATFSLREQLKQE
jgi:hypothetical protein